MNSKLRYLLAKKPDESDASPILVALATKSAESARNIIFGLLLLRIQEDILSRVVLNHLAIHKECRVIACSLSLLHVVSHDNNRKITLQFEN